MAFEEVGVKAVVQGLSKYLGDLNTIDKKTQGLGTSLGKVGGGIAKAFGGAAIGFAVGTLGKRMAELDNTMAGVAARAGLTAGQTDKLTKSVIKLSKSNLQGQTEIAGTAEALISLQGVEADNLEQIEKLTQQYLDYAKVTGQTAPDAVAAFDDILDAWNLTAEDGITIMDALVVSHQKFGTDIVGAQGALNKYAATFQTLGLDVNDALGYINLFAASGVDAESSATAFNKAVGLLTDNTDASNKKLAEMVTNLGFTTDQIVAFGQADPAGKFKMLTDALGSVEDPAVRAQGAIDLFGTKAGPKLAEALAQGNLGQFKIDVGDAAGASETAADKIDSTLTNKLKLLGNEITGRVQELTTQFAPALVLLGNPQITTALGGLAGLFLKLKVPSGLIDDLLKLSGALGGLALDAVGGTVTLTQNVVQAVTQTGKNVLDAGLDVIQNITQRITKVEVTPQAEQVAAKAGETAGKGFFSGFSHSLTTLIEAGTGASLGHLLGLMIERASLRGFLAGLSRAGLVGLAVAFAAGALIALEQAFEQLDYSRLKSILLTALTLNLFTLVPTALYVAADKLGATVLDAVVGGITSFFTPENIGRRLADLVAVAIIGMFALPILIIHFRKEIAGFGEMVGGAILDVLKGTPGFLADAGKFIVSSLIGVLMHEIEFPVIGGVKVWEGITGWLLPAPAVVYEFFKQGLADVLVNFLGSLPGIASEGLQKTGEGIGLFFSMVLPNLLTGQYFPVLASAFVTFFGTTLPNALIEVVPAIPGAILGALTSLPGLALGALELVTSTVSEWVTGLASWLGDTFIPWDWVKDAFGAFLTELQGWLDFIWGGSMIEDWVSGLGKWLTENFTPWEWVKAGVEALAKELGPALAQLGVDALNMLIAVIEGGLSLVVGAIRALFQGIKDVADAFPGPNPLGNAMQDAIDGMHDVTLDRIPDIKKDADGLGAGAIQGTIDGILSKQQALYSTLANLYNSIPATAKYLLQSGSPSKVMMEIGQNILDGLLLPLQSANATPAVRATVEQLIAAFVREINSGQVQTDDAMKHLADGLTAAISDPMALQSIINGAGAIVDAWVHGLQTAVDNAPPVIMPPPYITPPPSNDKFDPSLPPGDPMAPPIGAPVGTPPAAPSGGHPAPILPGGELYTLNWAQATIFRRAGEYLMAHGSRFDSLLNAKSGIRLQPDVINALNSGFTSLGALESAIGGNRVYGGALEVAPKLDSFFLNLLRSYGLAFRYGGSFLTRGPMIFAAGEAGTERVDITPMGATSPADMMASADWAGGQYASRQGGPMVTNIQVNAPFTVAVQQTDWMEIRTRVHAFIDEALGNARSEVVRSGVQPAFGVG